MVGRAQWSSWFGKSSSGSMWPCLFISYIREWLESSQVINLRRPTGRPNFQKAPQPPKTVPSSKDEQGPTEDILDLNLNTSLLASFSGHFLLCPGVINVVKRGKSSKNMKMYCHTVLQPQQSILESAGRHHSWQHPVDMCMLLCMRYGPFAGWRAFSELYMSIKLWLRQWLWKVIEGFTAWGRNILYLC